MLAWFWNSLSWCIAEQDPAFQLTLAEKWRKRNGPDGPSSLSTHFLGVNCEVLSNFLAIRIRLTVEAQVIPLYKQEKMWIIVLYLYRVRTLFLLLFEGREMSRVDLGGKKWNKTKTYVPQLVLLRGLWGIWIRAVGVMGQLHHNSISSLSLWFGSEIAQGKCLLCKAQ